MTEKTTNIEEVDIETEDIEAEIEKLKVVKEATETKIKELEQIGYSKIIDKIKAAQAILQNKVKTLSIESNKISDEIDMCKQQIRKHEANICQLVGHQWLEKLDRNGNPKGGQMLCVKCATMAPFNLSAMQSGKMPEEPKDQGFYSYLAGKVI